jgi:hypothetical protein
MKKKLIPSLVLASILIWTALLSNPAEAAGATISLSPRSGTYKVGKSFKVSVMLNSGGGAGVNAAEGVVKFDPNFISVTNTSYTSSIFELWTTKPAYSNTRGDITFAGGSPSAYKGSGGTIFTITFNALKSGTANVTFSSGLALAADGQGTNILSGFGSGKYILEEESTPKPETPKPTPNTDTTPKTPADTTTKKSDNVKKDTTNPSTLILPPAPKINSPSHPEEERWYSNNTPEFSWKLLSDVIGISYILTPSSTTNPADKTVGISESKKYDITKDGTWYFHVKYQNKNGWGPVSHRKALADATAPLAFTPKVDFSGDPTNPTPNVNFKTTDLTSGVDLYRVYLDGAQQEFKASDFKGAFTTSILLPGEHTLNISALDKAQNISSSTVKFFVDPLKPPVITEIPKTITKKDTLIIRGTSFYPEVKIKIYLGLEGKQPQELEATTDSQGNWSYFHNKNLDKGSYEIWAKVVDKRGAESSPTGKYFLSVIAPSIIELYGLYIIAALVLIILILLTIIIMQRDKFKKEILRARKETDETKENMGKVFVALREEVDELIEFADKKPGVTESEKRVRDKLREALDISEEFISKDIDDVEKELR